MVRFVLLRLKAWLEIVYSSSNAITANLLKLSDYLLIFIFISHPADEEKLLLIKNSPPLLSLITDQWIAVALLWTP